MMSIGRLATTGGRTALEILKGVVRMKTAMDGDSTLTAAQRERIIVDLLEFQRVKNVANADMARALLIARSTWTQIKNGTYGANPDSILRRAVRWMADRAERAEAPIADYVATSIGRQIMSVCKRAWAMPCLARVMTPSGAGKTAALLEFARTRGDRALYFQCGQAFSQDVGMLAELAAKLSIRAVARDTKATLYRQVRDRLAGFYAGGNADPFCLLIDEATTLRPNALNILRNLHDDRACRLAVVLADTWRLDAELRSRHGIAGGYEQLRSRVGAEFLLAADAPIPAADVRKVADGLLAKLGHHRPLSADSYRYLAEIGQGDGKFRNVVHRLHAVHDVAAALGQEAAYNPAELDFVADLVGGRKMMPNASCPFGRPSEPDDAPALKAV